ncbi:coagulation factor III, tissue factor a [Myripristis murdjan]|uniref:Tissue factor n=1 Tax=Myripristis murdjan TaxID=586833 RepID=A0A668AY60_9TELE|nr:tissue factor [Myripristis murdjan]
MLKSGVAAAVVALFVNVFVARASASDSFPKAQNVTWISTNFKTLLKWEPKPTADYTYTVEFSPLGKDRQRNPHCIRTTETMCDLTNSLSDVKATYSADVRSEPPRGVNSDLIEFPYTSSERFCPYKDTDIGKPDFKIEVSKDKRKTTLYVSDPLTALFENGRQLSIRDVFADELQYKVLYWRATSTGKKVHLSKSSEIELTRLDRGESYCFTVQAYIPTRSISKQLGDPSHVKCSQNDNPSIFDKYSVGVIVGGIFLILLFVGGVIAAIVFCCKRKRRDEKTGKEGTPLQSV